MATTSGSIDSSFCVAFSTHSVPRRSSSGRRIHRAMSTTALIRYKGKTTRNCQSRRPPATKNETRIRLERTATLLSLGVQASDDERPRTERPIGPTLETATSKPNRQSNQTRMRDRKATLSMTMLT
jgi:hypothetical protein